MLRVLYLLGWLVCFLVCCIAPLRAQAQDCAAQYRQQKYLEAGDCFLRSARKIGPSSRLKSTERLKKGAFLRSGAIALMKAAQATKSSPYADYLRERASAALRSYERDKLCASQSRCDAAKRQSQKLYGQIGYARLALHFSQTPIAVQVTGYRYDNTRILKRSPWRLSLRPGRYTIALIGLGQKKNIADILLKRSAKKIWRYQPTAIARIEPPPRRIEPLPRRIEPPPRRIEVRVEPRQIVVRAPVVRRDTSPDTRSTAVIKQIPPPLPAARVPTAAVVTYIIGGILLAAGVGTGIAAIVTFEDGASKFNNPTETHKDAQNQADLFRTIFPVSIALLAAGTGGLALGGILHAVLHKTPQTTIRPNLRPGNTRILMGGI